MYLKPQAIFFDFDGVVLESADIKTDAFLELFKTYPEHLGAIEKYHLENMGVSRFKKFEWIYNRLLLKDISENELKRLGEDFSNIVFEKVLKAPFVLGAEELLKQTVDDCLNFVASGTPEDELNVIVKERKLEQYFKEVCGSPKTKTQIVNELLVKYNLKAEECWFVGDANTDHKAARETRLHFVARNTPAMESYWKQQEDIWLVNSLQELLIIFQDV